MSKYQYRVSGTAAKGQTWTAAGQLEPALWVPASGVWLELPRLVLGRAYEQLTAGKAVFGKPGLGCQGPYRITKLEIEEVS